MINRKSVPLDPQTNMNAAEDFLLLVLHAHIVVAGETISSYVSVTSVSDLARRILNNYVYLPHPGAEEEESMETTHDGVHFYSMELLTLSLIWHSFHDAIKEGDGERIVRLKLLIIGIMPRRQYCFYFSTCTSFQTGRKNSFFGVVL